MTLCPLAAQGPDVGGEHVTGPRILTIPILKPVYPAFFNML